MQPQIAHHEAQQVTKQRNFLLVTNLIALVGIVFLSVAAATRSSEIILLPTLTDKTKLSYDRIDPDYLEMVSRDLVYLIVNRTPSGMEYFKEAVLRIVHPSAYGRMQNELDALIEVQGSSSVSQSCRLLAVEVDIQLLQSSALCEVRSYVGQREVNRERKTFDMAWSYEGLRLSLKNFTASVADKDRAAAIIARAKRRASQ